MITTKHGLLMADIAVTGPAGPPLLKALFRRTIPRHATDPQNQPIKSKLVWQMLCYQYGKAPKRKARRLSMKSALKVALSDLKPILLPVRYFNCIMFCVKMKGMKHDRRIGTHAAISVGFKLSGFEVKSSLLNPIRIVHEIQAMHPI